MNTTQNQVSKLASDAGISELEAVSRLLHKAQDNYDEVSLIALSALKAEMVGLYTPLTPAAIALIDELTGDAHLPAFARVAGNAPPNDAMNKVPLHLKGPLAGGEYTTCGVAFDAFNTGDADEPILIAIPGQVATCVECRRVVDFYKAIRGYREP